MKVLEKTRFYLSIMEMMVLIFNIFRVQEESLHQFLIFLIKITYNPKIWWLPSLIVI